MSLAVSKEGHEYYWRKQRTRQREEALLAEQADLAVQRTLQQWQAALVPVVAETVKDQQAPY